MSQYGYAPPGMQDPPPISGQSQGHWYITGINQPCPFAKNTSDPQIASAEMDAACATRFGPAYSASRIAYCWPTTSDGKTTPSNFVDTGVVPFCSIQERDASIWAGGTGGEDKGTVSCADSELMTGVKLRTGSWVDGISSIYCATPEQIANGSQPREVNVGFGNMGGGGQNIYTCPIGQALRGYQVRSGGWIDSLVFNCYNPFQFQTGDTPTDISKRFGGNIEFDGPQKRICPNDSFLSGISGKAGNALDSIKGICTATHGIAVVANNQNEQINCCAGINNNAFNCGQFQQGSVACNELQKSYCYNRDNFFSPACQEIIGGKDRIVRTSSDDDAVRKICTDVKLNPSQKGTSVVELEDRVCSCYNAEIPQNIPEVARGIYQCITPACTAGGMRPLGLQCPSALTICGMKDFTTTLNQSDVGKFWAQNNCGNVTSTTQTDGTTTTPTSPTESSSTGTGSWLSRNGLLVGGSIAFLILVGLLAALLQAIRGLNKK